MQQERKELCKVNNGIVHDIEPLKEQNLVLKQCVGAVSPVAESKESAQSDSRSEAHATCKEIAPAVSGMGSQQVRTSDSSDNEKKQVIPNPSQSCKGKHAEKKQLRTMYIHHNCIYTASN